MPSSIPVTTLIPSSMRLCGALASGEQPTPEEYTDALLVLNDLYEQMSTNKLAMWGTLNQTFTLVPGQAQYTIGPSGNFNTQRPVDISAAYCTFSGVDFPIRIIAMEEYDLINLKTMQQPIVERMVYTNDFPLGVLTFWPVPLNSNTVTLTIARVLDGDIAMNDVLTGPPGFTKYVRYQLAIELAAEFGQEVPPAVVAKAAEITADYKSSNAVDVVSRLDDAILTPPVALYQRGY